MLNLKLIKFQFWKTLSVTEELPVVKIEYRFFSLIFRSSMTFFGSFNELVSFIFVKFISGNISQMVVSLF